MTIKRLTFVRRADGVAPDEFALRWRYRARELNDSASAGARPSRLVHCIVRPGRTDRPYHGAAIAWFDDEVALAASDEHSASAPGEPLVDTSTVVSALVEERTVFGQALLERWWRGDDGGTRLLLLGMVQRKPELSREEFAQHWWSRHRPLANRVLPAEVQPPIYVHDYALEGQRCPWDGVGEFYDTSVDVARQRTQWADAGGTDAEAIVVDEERFLVRETRYALITDAEVVVPAV